MKQLESRNDQKWAKTSELIMGHLSQHPGPEPGFQALLPNPFLSVLCSMNNSTHILDPGFLHANNRNNDIPFALWELPQTN